MRHYIIAKFKPGVDWHALVEPVRAIFQETLSIEGVTGVWVYPSSSDRENRYHLMIEMELTPEALKAYDTSEPHLRWKETYGPLLESKTIFDREERKTAMSRKKKLILIAALLLVLILGCVPVRLAYKDGGTVKYQAVLWSYTRYHQLTGTGDYYQGTEFRVFPFNFAPPSQH